MFVGHYSVSLAAGRAEKTVPLWVWFVGAQWLDLFFMAFVLTGVEKMRLTPGFTETNALDLYWMPYSHGLVGAAVLSLSFATLVALLLRPARRPRTVALLALVSFSHWILDVAVHTPDMALANPHTRVGLGLWNHPSVELPLELLLVALTAGIYARGVSEPTIRRRVWIVVLVMIVLQLYSTFGPIPPSVTAFATSALAAFGILTAAAWWVERAAPEASNSISSAR